MSLVNYLFGNKNKKSTKETHTQTETSTQKIYLLYGAKVTFGHEESYIVGVFNNEILANKELNNINEKNKLTNIGRSIICPETGINEYHYQYYIIECDLNKNYNKSIEYNFFGNLPY